LRNSRASHAAVLARREFVANLPSTKQYDAVELCGTRSGKDTDKFEMCRLGKLPATVVAAPLIAECPINLECKVVHVLPLGSHDLVVAEIVKTHVDHQLLREDGTLDDTALDCLAWGAEEFLRVLPRRNHLRVPRFQ
jgi:flavin reductase (DIM6/NTAB) family NADH-FMN oxidoreductase RutF